MFREMTLVLVGETMFSNGISWRPLPWSSQDTREDAHGPFSSATSAAAFSPFSRNDMLGFLMTQKMLGPFQSSKNIPTSCDTFSCSRGILLTFSTNLVLKAK